MFIRQIAGFGERVDSGVITGLRVACKIGAIFAVSIGLGACDQADRGELENKVALLEAENNQLRLAADSAGAASERYDACLADAHSRYVARWNNSCTKQRDYDLRQRRLCKDNGASDDYCAAIEISSAKDCSLSVELADSYNADYKSDERLCMARLKLGR